MRRNAPTYLDRLERHYGTTRDPLLGGFLLPTGEFLDFSEGSGSRAQDHRNVTWASVRAESDRESRYDVMLRIAKRVGMYRWMPENWAITAWTAPTSAQVRVLRELFRMQEPVLDLERGRRRLYREYESWNAHEAVPDLIRFFGGVR